VAREVDQEIWDQEERGERKEKGEILEWMIVAKKQQGVEVAHLENKKQVTDQEKEGRRKETKREFLPSF
jgi:hypothetical protein